MKLTNAFQNIPQQSQTPAERRGETPMNHVIGQQAASHVQQVHPEAVQPTVRQEDPRFQKVHDMVDRPVSQQGKTKRAQQYAEGLNSEQAQLVLERSADQLARRATQFQNFLTGGGSSGTANWAASHGRGSNIANHLFGAGISYMIRG